MIGEVIRNAPLGLFERMRLFGIELSPEEQGRLCYAATFNDLRLFEDDAATRHALIRALYDARLARPLPWSRDYDTHEMPVLTPDNWARDLAEIVQRLRGLPGSKPFHRSLVLNRHLVRAGLCPLLHFAFDDWHDPDRDPAASVDLSTTYLYRLAGVLPQPTATVVGQGAYSYVVLCDGCDSVEKIPRNVAAFRFACHQEYLASRHIETSALAPHVPELIGFDEETGRLRRARIDGPSGSDLLAGCQRREDIPGRDQLCEIWMAANTILRRDAINLDIHPGNFLWDIRRQRWVLVDLGPMPRIGAEYFPRHSFDAYLDKIWLDLRQLMVAVPIRSTDIGDIGDVPHDFYKTFKGP